MGNMIQTKIMGKEWLVRAILLLIMGLLPVLSVAQEEINPFAGGEGSGENPYQIENWEQLNEVRNYLDSSFILINDLDQNSTGYDDLASPAANEGQGWEPIGTYVESFTGSFDGNGYTISDLFIDRLGLNTVEEDSSDNSNSDGTPDGVGLFGYISTGLFSDGTMLKTDHEDSIFNTGIENLHLENVNIRGVIGVGAVAGVNEGLLSNVSVSGEVKGLLITGGITGANIGIIVQGSTDANVLFDVERLIELNNVEQEADIPFLGIGGMGGLAGYNIGGVILSNSGGNVGFTEEVITELEELVVEEEIFLGIGFFPIGYGGLVGINESEFLGAVTVSYSTANVGGLFGTGGLIGLNGFDFFLKGKSFIPFDFNSSLDIADFDNYLNDLGSLEVRDTYATGTVNGLYSTGGLIGGNSGSVYNSYSAGKVGLFEEALGDMDEEIPIDPSKRVEEDPEFYEELGLGGLIGEGFGFLPLKYNSDIESFRFSFRDLENSVQEFSKMFDIEEEPESQVFNSFWDLQTSGIPVSGGGTGLNTREMKTIFTYLNVSWDFNNLWAIEEGYSGPSLPFKGNGVYVSYPYFGNNPDAPLQDPLPGLSELGTERVLAGSAMETIIDITDLDFGSGESITVTQVPPEFTGVLKLNGNIVDTDDEIQKADVEDGNLVFESGFNNRYENSYISDTFLSFQYENADRTVNLFIDNAARSIWYDEPEGWYLFASPSIDQTVGDLLDGIRTDGFSGSTNPSASFPTVYILNQEQYRWEAVNSINQELEQGQALLVYVFQENLDELDENNPELLASDGPWLPLDGSYSYNNVLDYDPDQGSGGNSFFLLANPHPIDINICRSLMDAERVANNFYKWIPSENDGNGGYVNYLCDIELQDGPQRRIPGPTLFSPVRPFEGFWVRTTDVNPSLTITEEAYGAPILRKKENETERSVLQPLSLNVNHNDRNFSGSVHILFSDFGKEDLDNYDALHLSSSGLAERYLSIFALDEEGRKYFLKSLPQFTHEERVIALGFETTESGNYTFQWNLPSNSPSGITYYLRDNKTGSLNELNSGGRYVFYLETSEVFSGEESLEEGAGVNAKDSRSDADHRFELIATMKELRTDIELPANIALKQNYPNPFNPTTVIEYQLPQSAQVSLQVYDMAGRQVAELVNDQVSAGTHTINFDASNLSSGVYMYRLQAGTTMLTRKLTVVK